MKLIENKNTSIPLTKEELTTERNDDKFFKTRLGDILKNLSMFLSTSKVHLFLNKKMVNLFQDKTRYSLTILSICCVSISFGQIQKEEVFARTVRAVILSLSKRDSIKLSNFIDKKTGVYILNSAGTKQTYNHFKNIGFSDSSYPNGPFYDKVKITSINFAPLPTYNCGTQKWTKRGLYVDTSKVEHALSQIAKSRNKDFQDNIPTKTISNFSELEAKSRKVVVAANNGDELIFYLTCLNKKWVLTIIDKVTCDCSV